MFQRLEDVEKRYDELTIKISDPNEIANTSNWQKLMKEHAEITPIVEKYREYKKYKNTIEENQELLKLIADALLEHETLTKEQIEYLVKHKEMPKEEVVEESNVKHMSYEDLSLTELKSIAKEAGISGYTKMTKEELIKALEKEDE